jgi:PHD/YefM family antitoxin component YafN of YafNO toxin-antitoxin module
MIELVRLKEERGEVRMSKEDFEAFMTEVESLIETVEILSDEDLMKQLKESEKDVEEGRVHEIKSPEDLKRLFSD